MEYLKLIRPWHWLKNFFVFVPIFFAREFFIWEKISLVSWAFAAFCCLASCVYIINDLVDRNKDREHPTKKFRPLASGQVSVLGALSLFFILLVITILIVGFKAPAVWPILTIYFILNLAYSFYLKNVVVADILTIALFYLLRILAGGMVADIFISRWLILCVIFLALFIIIGKRHAEFSYENKREVLKDYSSNLLDHLLTIATGLTILSYSIYTILGPVSPLAVYSIFFVLLGIFRYLFIVYSSQKAEYPEKLIFKDKIILSSVVAWGIYMFVIFYK